MYKVMKTFICKGCMIPVTVTVCTSADIGVNANLELEDKIRYLVDTLSVDRYADEAVEKRIQIGLDSGSQYHCLPMRIYH